jgi:hypothetical protein
LAEFRAASQVTPGSYADELVERIHNCLFKYPSIRFAQHLKNCIIRIHGILLAT